MSLIHWCRVESLSSQRRRSRGARSWQRKKKRSGIRKCWSKLKTTFSRRSCTRSSKCSTRRSSRRSKQISLLRDRSCTILRSRLPTKTINPILLRRQSCFPTRKPLETLKSSRCTQRYSKTVLLKSRNAAVLSNKTKRRLPKKNLCHRCQTVATALRMTCRESSWTLNLARRLACGSLREASTIKAGQTPTTWTPCLSMCMTIRTWGRFTPERTTFPMSTATANTIRPSHRVKQRLRAQAASWTSDLQAMRAIKWRQITAWKSQKAKRKHAARIPIVARSVSSAEVTKAKVQMACFIKYRVGSRKRRMGPLRRRGRIRLSCREPVLPRLETRTRFSSILEC